MAMINIQLKLYYKDIIANLTLLDSRNNTNQSSEITHEPSIANENTQKLKLVILKIQKKIYHFKFKL